MGSTYSTCGDCGMLCKILIENVKETTLLDARILLKRHLKEIGYKFVGWIRLDGVQWRFVAIM